MCVHLVLNNLPSSGRGRCIGLVGHVVIVKSNSNLNQATQGVLSTATGAECGAEEVNKHLRIQNGTARVSQQRHIRTVTSVKTPYISQ